MTTSFVARPSGEEELSSRAPLVEVHALWCGHGDTIFLHFVPASKWILIDTNLAKSRGRRKHFFDFVTQKKIRRLEAIVLTHPDVDHYRGMSDVISFFSRNGRSFRVFYQGGAYPKNLIALMRRLGGKKENVTEYEKLRKALKESGLSRGKREFVPVSATTFHKELEIKGMPYKTLLIPIAPNETVQFLIESDAEDKIERGLTPRVDLNALSIVFMLAIAAPTPVLAVFPGDLLSTQWELALETWNWRRAEQAPWIPAKYGPALIKVPHHGSFKSHDSSVLRRGGYKGKRVALLSVGRKTKKLDLPSRAVLRDYLQHKFAIESTTIRRPGRKLHRNTKTARRSGRAASPVQAHGKSADDSGADTRTGVRYVEQDVVATLFTDGTWNCAGQQIVYSHLSLYS